MLTTKKQIPTTKKNKALRIKNLSLVDNNRLAKVRLFF